MSNALKAYFGKGNSVKERMQLQGVSDGDTSGLEVQNAIFGQWQACRFLDLFWFYFHIVFI